MLDSFPSQSSYDSINTNGSLTNHNQNFSNQGNNTNIENVNIAYCLDKYKANRNSSVCDLPNRSVYLNELVDSFELSSNNNEDESNIKKLIERAEHWCLVNGFVAIPKDRKLNELMHVSYLPFTLFPSPFSKIHFEQVFKLQPNINNLISNISNSAETLEKNFKSLVLVDAFIASLWKIYKDALKNGFNQPIQLSIFRCDYMLHEEASDISNCKKKVSMKQVEMNTIAAGFGYVSTKASLLHREILKWTNNTNMYSKTPENKPIVRIANGFAEAWRLYNVKNSIVLFIVLDYEINIADQRHLEYEIEKAEPLIEIQRCTLTEFYRFGSLSSDKVLYYNNREVSIVYYRAGYAPEHFKTNEEWESLLRIELSKAIKCPTIGTFLSGMKKFQEFLVNRENLMELCQNNQELVNSFQSVFAKFFKLDSKENIEKVLKNPEDYVLKPQREGGGNNLYNNQIKELLLKIVDLENKKNEQNQNGNGLLVDDVYNKDLYIVMELLRPPVSQNYIISAKSQMKKYNQNASNVEKKVSLLDKIEITNELGIYGVILKNGSKTIINEAAGYCLRSKPAEDNEGGVMCGSGALDSLYFFD